MKRGCICLYGVWISLLFCCAMQVASAQNILEQPYRLSLLQDQKNGQTNILLAHNFPDFVQMRIVYAYSDGSKFVHRISTMLQGYHKVWSLRPMPDTATDLQFLSLTVSYGNYTLQCAEKDNRCVLFQEKVIVDSTIVFNPRPDKIAPEAATVIAVK